MIVTHYGCHDGYISYTVWITHFIYNTYKYQIMSHLQQQKIRTNKTMEGKAGGKQIHLSNEYLMMKKLDTWSQCWNINEVENNYKHYIFCAL